MKSNLFKYSVLTVGVVAAMGVAHAATPTIVGNGNTGSFSVANQAEATYTVAGNGATQTATSNTVTITVNEQSTFELIADNVDKPINPKAASAVSFAHTLTNKGNVNDSYILSLANATNGNATGQDDFDYTGYVVTYVKNGVTTNLTIGTNGRAITAIALAPNEVATITIVATAATARNIDKNGILTVSAESAYLKAKPANTDPKTYTASNVDNAKTVAPLYAIKKSATTNLGTRNLDLNNTDAYVDYTITIKNEGNLGGKAVTIEDAMPNGLTLVPFATTAPTIKRGTTAISVTPTLANNTITFAGIDIAINETITVTFRAKKATGATSADNSFVNYAVVKDDTANDANANAPDITDRSDDETETTYENKVTGNAYLGKDDNTKATVTTSNQTRAIAITTGVNKEVALSTSGAAVGNTYSYTITNNGTDITEAATPGSVLFSVKPTATGTTGVTDNTKIEIARVFVDANGDGVFTPGETVLTGTRIDETSEYTYDLNAAKTAGFAPGTANAIKIGVEVVTTGSNSNAGGVGTSDIGKYETMTLSVLPQGAVNQTPAPANATTTSKTTMQGINLVKYQIAADCGTTIPADNATTWSTAAATATAGQCVFYRLEATNTFNDTTKTISDVVITDNLATTLAYQSATFAATPTTTDQTVGQKVKATFATLAPAAKVNVKFSAKPSQSGTNTSAP